MKLGTDIKPRRDGNVVAEFGKTEYVFMPDADGHLTCDVRDDDIAMLIESGNFYPVDEEGIERGIALLTEAPIEAARQHPQRKKASNP